MKFFWRFLATGFYSGYVPRMPGTAGSLVAGVLLGFTGNSSLLFYALLGIFLVLGTVAAGRMEKEIGSTDPSCVVIDEFAGMFVAAALMPAAGFGWLSVAVCFVLFRLFDIWKPWPIDRIQALPGGFGIMADDVLAGIYAGVLGRAGFVLAARLFH